MFPEPQFHEERVRENLRASVPTPPPPRRWFRRFLYAAFAVTFLLCVVPELVFMPLRLLFEVAFGWVLFLRRQLPHVRPSGAEVVFSVIVLVLLTGVLHATARSMYGANGRWRLRWTLGLLLVAGMLFATGTSVAGVGRQLIALGELPVWLHDVGPWKDIKAQISSRYNLKNIGVALWRYDEKSQQPPPGGTFDELGRPMHSWVTSLLPYLDQTTLYDRIRRDQPWSAPENQAAFQTQLEAMQVPYDRTAPKVTAAGYAIANYAANVHVMGPNHTVPFYSMTDGTSNTIAIGEAMVHPRAWGDPRNWRDPAAGINTSPEAFGFPSSHRAGCTFLFADGSVRFVSQNIDRDVLRKLATPDGGEEIGDGAY